MKIVVLSDNRSSHDAYTTEHGLSVYIEKDGYKLLFDTGASDLFIRNAERLQIDLSQVDYLFISHAHADHIGGLMDFLQVNQQAKIVLSKHAFNRKLYSRRVAFREIGNQFDIQSYADRFLWVEDVLHLHEDIVISAITTTQYPFPKGNRTLFMETAEGVVQDDFSHEIVIAVGKADLFVYTGCAHHGLLNMLETVKQHSSKPIATVLGGFHLLDSTETQVYESKSDLDFIIDKIKSDYAFTQFYTGHCTGNQALSYLRKQLMQQIKGFEIGVV